MLQIELTKPLKKKLLMALPLALLLLLYLAGLLMQALRTFPDFDGMSFNPITVVWLAASSRTGWMTVGGIVAALIFIFILAKWKDRALNNVAFTDERGIQFAKTGTYGVARPLRESELEAATADFTVGPVGKQDGYILGRLDTDQQEVRFLGGGQTPDPSSIKGRSGKRTISLKRQRKGNYNILVVGGSGSGKSAGFVRANILQAVKAGESVVVTDPVGELYTTFYKTFTEMGIECKAFNLAQPEFSDSWACLDEILDPVTGEPSEDRIADFATIIIENTGGQTKDPTHSMGQQQLLNALIHTLSYTVKTKTAKEYGALLDELEMTGSLKCAKAWINWARRQLDPRCMISNKKRYEIIQKALAASSWSEEEKKKQWRIHMDKVPELSLSTIYHMLATHTPETIGSLVNGSVAEGFERLPEGHPGRIAFHFFDNQNEKLKYGMLGNLGTRLQLLQSRNIRRILRNKDIRLADAGDHQVVWFVIIPDQSTTTRAISSLFFNFLFKDNADMSDALGGRNRVRVNFIMDEFANIGLIPNIDKKINIARGRNLSLCMILQDIKQLDNVYGMEAAPVIISGCNTIVFLGSDNPETCEFFSRLSGEATIVVNTVRNSRGVGRVDPLAKEYQQSTGEGKRYVYTEHEVRTLPKEECLIWVSGYNVLKARKFWWFTHPGSRTADGEDLPEMKPSTHIPAAVKYQDTEYRDAFLDNDDLIFIEAEEEPPDAPDAEEPGMEPPDEPSEQEEPIAEEPAGQEQEAPAMPPGIPQEAPPPEEVKEPPQTASEAPRQTQEADPERSAQTDCAPPEPKPLNMESFRKVETGRRKKGSRRAAERDELSSSMED